MLCGVLDIAPNYLLAVGADEFSPAEKLLIKKYRDLDDTGRKHVDTVISWEFERLLASAVQEAPAPAPVRIISYYQRLASAGSGEYLFDSVPCDTIEVLDSKVSDQADFVIGVIGSSMEPTYRDGDKVFVRIAEEIPTGHIGIFTRGNDCFIKELGCDRLISHNKNYPDIPASEDIRLVGEVLGKASEI